jgi:nicotinamidase/pyrazinamidase
MKTAYIDVDTQIDFVFPAGALYVPGAEKILGRVGELNRETWPHHCVVGSLGQRKAAETIVEGAIAIEKQKLDCFTNPRMEALLKEHSITDAVVYGVVTELCVLHAAQGLMDRGIRVRIAADAVKELSATARDLFFEEVRSRGGRID